MKKIFALIAILILLAACEYAEPHMAAADEGWLEYSSFDNRFAVSVADDELLSRLEYVHEADWGNSHGQDILIWAVDEPLVGFEFIRITHAFCVCCWDFYFLPGEVMLSLEYLPPGHAMLLRNYVGHGPYPGYAVSFLGDGGDLWYVSVMPSLASEGEPFFMTRFAHDAARTMPFAPAPWRTGDLKRQTPYLNIYCIPPTIVGNRNSYEAHEEIVAEAIDGFENAFRFAYNPISWSDTLLLWPNEPLRDVSIVSLGINGCWAERHIEQPYFYVREVLFAVDELMPLDVIVPFGSFLGGTAQIGVMFTTQAGEMIRMFVVRWNSSYYFVVHTEDHWARWIDTY